MMPSRLSYVWLAQRNGLGAGTAAELLRAFGSPEAVYAADRAALTASACPLRKAQVDTLCDKNTDEAARIIEQCTRAGIQILTILTVCARSPIRRLCSMCAEAGRILM